MKILQVYKNYFPMHGGIESTMRALCEDAARRGHHVSALVANSGQVTTREKIANVEVIRAGSMGSVARAPLSAHLFWEMSRLRPDVTLLHFPYPIGELAQLLFGRAKRVVVLYHSDIVKQRTLLRLYQPFLRRLLARADRIIATSPNYVRSSPYLSPLTDKCVVIPPGVDPSRFARPDPLAVSRLRAQYGAPLVLFVGLFRYYKGLQYLIPAMRDVPAKLVLVGAGPLEDELRAQAKREGLGEKVFFAGAVSDADLPSYYHACDVFVLPACQRSEAFGLAQVEAMLCEKPVVSTELGTGTSYANLEGVTGLVAPPRDPIALAVALNKLIADPALRDTLGKAAAARARREFSQAAMCESVDALYRELIENS